MYKSVEGDQAKTGCTGLVNVNVLPESKLLVTTLVFSVLVERVEVEIGDNGLTLIKLVLAVPEIPIEQLGVDKAALCGP